jgi:hypothetical protein
MCPELRTKPISPLAASDIYTVLLAAAFFTVLVTFLFVAVKSYGLFGSLFPIIKKYLLTTQPL